MTFDSNRNHLPYGYVERLEPEYFIDEDSSGIVWQPNVYPATLSLAKTHDRDTIIDLGCGRASKLSRLRREHRLVSTEPVGRSVGRGRSGDRHIAAARS